MARGTGIYAYTQGTASRSIDAYCYDTGLNSYAGYFSVPSGHCIRAEVISSSVAGSAVYANINPNTGSHINSYAIHGIGGTNDSGSSPGYAGFFQGDIYVTGFVSAGLGKPFKIDHPLDPENKYLFHCSVESPEMRTVYYGQTATENGSVLINLPDWWIALNGTDKSEYTYSLTPIGKWCQLYVSKEIENNQFEISSTGGDCKFSWTVTAIRHDTLVEEKRMRIEVEKTPEEKERDKQAKKYY
jgi:hypothetical protein